MQRRNFIKGTALSAIAISATGFIRFNDGHYEGDCETTTDILGPFYRPDAPVRTDMRIKDALGQLMQLKGQVRHKDCVTPLKNACIELWHCDGKGVYDNESPAFNYRAKAYCDDNGNYSFKTILPVPYDAGNGSIRPAHFHMMISAPGYQSLITQLYFTGDQNISKDTTASSPSAKRRILDIKDTPDNEKAVIFNVTMMEKLPAATAVLERLAGKYVNADTNGMNPEFYVKDKFLWIKHKSSINGGYALQYNGNNTFELYGQSANSFHFEPLMDGTVKLTFTQNRPGGEKRVTVAVKGRES